MQDLICPSCDHINPVDSFFCSSCDDALTLRCPQCANRQPLPSLQCGACGGILPGGADAATGADTDANADTDSDTPVAQPLPSEAAHPRPNAPGEVFSAWRLDRFSSRPGDRALDAPSPQVEPPSLVDRPRLAGAEDVSAWIWGHTDANTDAEAAALLESLDIDDSAAAAWLPLAAAQASARILSEPAPPVSASQALKAKRRAFVRRARLNEDRPAPMPPGATLHALVLDKDAVARVELCALLEGFGFCAHPARTHAQAHALLGLHKVVAAFLCVVLDGNEADEASALCLSVGQLIRAAACAIPQVEAPVTAQARTALVIVGSGARPVERVRARLAGADEFLDKPASRGGLARALDTCGVAMPADPRRA